MLLLIQNTDLPASPADKNSADPVPNPDFQSEADTKADRAKQDTHYVSIHPIGVVVQCCSCHDFVWLRPEEHRNDCRSKNSCGTKPGTLA
jgi:hypothetical protein